VRGWKYIGSFHRPLVAPWVIEHTKPGDDAFGTYCTTEVEAGAYAK